jgi:hypothetical protein
MSDKIKRSTLALSEIENAAAAAVQRAVAAREQAGIELSDEQLNSVSGGAGFYFRDYFIYGILVDPIWFRPAAGGFEVNPAQVATKTLGR